MESFEDLVVGEKKQITGNIWGRKWSLISLGIVIAGLLFMVFIGPKDAPVQIFEEESVDTTVVVEEQNN